MYVCTMFVPNDWTAASISTWEKFRWLKHWRKCLSKDIFMKCCSMMFHFTDTIQLKITPTRKCLFFRNAKKKKSFVIMNTWFSQAGFKSIIDSIHSSDRTTTYLPTPFLWKYKLSTPVWLHWPVEDWFSSLKTRKNGNFKWALGSSSRISITFFSYEIGSSLINSDGSTVAFVRS